MQLFATGLIGEDGLAHCKGEGLVVGSWENARLICRETECQATVPGSNPATLTHLVICTYVFSNPLNILFLDKIFP